MYYLDRYFLTGLVFPASYAVFIKKLLLVFGLCRFEEGAEQFRFDVAANPNDTEESIWCFLCEARLYGANEARKRFLEASQWLLGISCSSSASFFVKMLHGVIVVTGIFISHYNLCQAFPW